MDNLASRVRTRRRELGLSQAQLAEEAGLRQSLISKIENGLVQRTMAVLPLSRVLQCDPRYLASGDSSLAPEPAAGPVLTMERALLKIVEEFRNEPEGVRSAAAELIAHALRQPEAAPDMARRLEGLGGHKYS